MKLALKFAAVLLVAVAASPATAQRGGGTADSGRLGASLRGTVEAGRVISRDAERFDRGDSHQARRRWNAANDTGTRIRRPGNHHARRRWNAANNSDR
jgi:hypothetical protein